MTDIICNPNRIKAELLFQDVIENGSAMFRRDFVMKNNIRYRDGYLGMEDYKFWTDCSVKGRLANISTTLLYWRKTADSETNRILKERVMERKEKFAQIQQMLIIEYGFLLTEKELNIFTDCFEEDKRGRLGRKELNEVYKLVNKMLEIARNQNIDYYNEFQLVLKRRFAQKVEYASFWDDGDDLFLEEKN